MIVPDINLLLYAHDADSSFHMKAKAWWERCLSGSEQVGLPEPVIFGFIRVATNSRAFRNPLKPEEATAYVRAWLKQPVVQILDTGHDYVEDVLKLLEGLGTAGNLVTDAQIAALTIEYAAVLHTSDSDFVRFPDLKWFNPISAAGSRTLRKRGS